MNPSKDASDSFSEIAFFDFYFEDTKKPINILPKGVKQSIKSVANAFFNPKNVNKQYISEVIKSSLFKSHFQDFLEN